MVSPEQLETLQKSDHKRPSHPFVMRSIKLIQSYNQISDEFGFNPKQDRAAIIQELNKILT